MSRTDDHDIHTHIVRSGKRRSQSDEHFTDLGDDRQGDGNILTKVVLDDGPMASLEREDLDRRSLAVRPVEVVAEEVESQCGDVSDAGGDQLLRRFGLGIHGEDRLLAIVGHEDLSRDRVERHPVEEDLVGIGLGRFVTAEGLRFQFDEVVGDSQQEVLTFDRLPTGMFVRFEAHSVGTSATVAFIWR